MRTPKTVIQALVKKHGSLRKASKACGVSLAMCSEVLAGIKTAGPKTLRKLGLKVVYK